ncbi:MAG: acetolactate synthase [Candidatus Dormibacteraeota bacterium]|nr:acetolactate synthase [Candidatus Dormibacteraeota bacterium]
MAEGAVEAGAEVAGTGGLLALALKHAGLGPIFTLNGGHIWGLYLGAQELGVPMVDVRHEQSAGFAAEGWAKVTRRCGVAAVTAGPGVTNVMSAIASSAQNDSPVFFLGGRAPVARWGMGSLQELDHLPLVETLVKSAGTVLAASDAYRLASEAVRTALSARTGPTFLDVPLDVFLQAEDAPEATERLVPNPGQPPDHDEVRKAADLLAGAARPAIVAGTGVWWARAEEELLRLAESAGLPVVLNGMARGMVPPGHRLFASRARAVALGEADVILVVGVPLDFRLNFGQPPVIGQDARVVYLDVDARHENRPAAAAVHGDLKAALGELIEAAREVRPREDWIERVAQAGASAVARDADLAATGGSPVHPARLVTEVGRHCDTDAILVGDGGDFVSFAGRLLHRERPGLWIDGGPYGCLGSGPGYAMAAKLAHPDRQVVLLSGDGAFGFSAMEFDTLVRHRIPVVCVVGNNGIWALEKHPMERLLGSSLLADLAPGTRYDLLVASLGGHGELVERPEEIGPALERAFRSGLPACVNVVCDPKAEYPRSSVLM